MPWKEKSVEQLREGFINDVISGQRTFADVCRIYGISRPTGYKWLKRYRENYDLSNQSRRPFSSPRKTSDEIEEVIISVRKDFPKWGPRKIKKFLQNHGHNGLPSTSTISSILKRNNLITPEASAAATPHRRFEHDQPNELWQVDFKGWVLMKNKERCYPLTMLDDHSRFLLSISAKVNEQHEGVWETFHQTFSLFGIPDAILCDNGNPWGNSQGTGYTKIEVRLMKLGILPIHGRAGHPQTQGKTERFNRTLKNELMRHIQFLDLDHAQEEFLRYRQIYNHIRPHDAINLEVPARLYTPSLRRYPLEIQDFFYPPEAMLYKVRGNGCISFRGQDVFIGMALEGEAIWLLPSEQQELFTVYFREFQIGLFNSTTREVTKKRIRWRRVSKNDLGYL